MSEPVTPGDSVEDRAAAGPESASAVRPGHGARSTSREKAHAATRALSRLGTWVGWGLPVIGLLAGWRNCLERAVVGSTTPAAWTPAIIDTGILITAYGLA